MEQQKSYKAEGFTFGIEVECYVNWNAWGRDGCYAGGYHSGGGVLADDIFPEGWRAEGDSSLSGRKDNELAVEIISPVLKGIDGIRQLEQVCAALNERYSARVDAHCGLHIHVGVESVAGWDRSDQADFIAKLLHLVAHYELGLYATTGNVNRWNGHYAAPVNGDRYSKGLAKKVQAASPYDKAHALNDVSWPDRYRSLNVTNFLGGQATVEFRLFSGSTSPVKIAAWVQLCLGLCERAQEMDRYPSWEVQVKSDRVNSPEYRLHVLLGALGWRVGFVDRGLMFCTARGIIADVGEIGRYRAELQRLAKKFGGQYRLYGYR